MATTINSNTTDGLVITPDTSGEVKIQSDGTDVVTFDSNGMNMATGMTLPASKLTGTVPSDVTVNSSSLSGNLPALNGSAITNLTSANLTGALPAIDGSSLTGVSGGKILQVKNTLTSSRASYTANNNNTGNNISPINTTITPSATSSKVWITITITFECNHDTVFELYRNSTVIGRNTASSSRWSGTFLPSYDVDNGSTPRTNTYTYLDSPNTTSARTYKLYVHSSNGSNHTLRLNRSMNNAGADSHEIATSSMTLMEVGA